MAGKIDWLWLLVGIALGFFVAPMVVGMVKGKTTKKAS